MAPPKHAPTYDAAPADRAVFPAPRRGQDQALVAFERDAFFERLQPQDHADHELTLVLEGRGERRIGGEVTGYEEGDLCLVPLGVPHGWQAPRQRPVRALVVHFSPDLTGALGHLPQLLRLQALLNQRSSGLVLRGAARDETARELEKLVAEPDGSWRRILRLVDLLARVSDEGAASLVGANPAARDPRLQRVLGYVAEHLDQEISFAEAAALAGLTPAAFSRFFARGTGKNFREHVLEMRIALACRDLVGTDASITDIAFRTGFGSLAHFNRSFRRARGLTPSAFRARHRPR